MDNNSVQCSVVGAEGPDFSYLPETAWVKVMECLPLVDQYHVSVTCSTLYHVFSHPTLWRSARLFLIGGHHNFGMSSAFMPDQFKKIVEKFGHIFQRLTIILTGHLVRMEQETRDILANMAQVCRLEHLVLEVGILTSQFHCKGIGPFREDLLYIVQLAQNAFRLKKLEIISWPMFPEVFSSDELNVFQVIMQNTKLQNLESLSLFGMKDKQWSELIPILPSPAYTLTIVSHFKNLQHLALRSPMLSNELLAELATSGRKKLLTMHILIMYSAHNLDYFIPDLSSSAWIALKSANPELEVECAIMSRVPDMELAVMLKPDIPLVKITILKFSTCTPQLLSALKDKFHKSLQFFVCYCDPNECDSQLLDLTTACTKLTGLIFHGHLHKSTIMNIIGLRKEWKTFEIVEKCIITEDQSEQYDDNDVIVRDASGDLVQRSLIHWHSRESEEERKQALKELSLLISEKMGYNWKPLA